MNFSLLFVFIYSVMSFVKDISKGWKDNRENVIFDIIFSTAAAIPLAFNLIFFIRRDCNHKKVFLVNLEKFIRMDSFDESFRNRCVDGNWIFCTNEEDSRIANISENYICEHDPRVKSNLGLGGLKSKAFLFSDIVLNKKFQSFSYLNRRGTSLIAGLESLIPNFRIDFKIVNENDENIKVVYKKGKLRVSKMTDSKSLKEYDCSDMPVGSIARFLLENCLCTSEKIVRNHIRLIERFEVGKLGYTYEVGRCKSLDVDFLNIVDYNKFLCLWCEESVKDIISDINHNAKKAHVLNVKDLVSMSTRMEINTKLFEFKIPFYRLESSMSQAEAVIDKAVNCLNFENLSNDLSFKFGRKLSDFLCFFTVEHFGFENCRALKYILTKGSCWDYRLIGSNWKSKRYLCDVNYIFSKANVPALTHIDRKLKPSSKVKSYKNIPLCENLISRARISYCLSKCFKRGSTTDNGGDKTPGVVTLGTSGLRALRSHHDRVRVSGFSEMSEKNSKNFNKIKPLITEIVTNENDNLIKSRELNNKLTEKYNYRDALLKGDPMPNLNLVRRRCLSLRKAVLDKIVLPKIKGQELSNLKKLKDDIEISSSLLGSKIGLSTHELPILSTVPNAQGKYSRRKGKFFLKDNEHNKILLKNSFSALSKYIDETEAELSRMPAMDPGLISDFVGVSFRKNLGYTKNCWNMKKILTGSRNYRDNFNFCNELNVTVESESCDLIRSKIIDNLDCAACSTVTIHGRFRKAKIVKGSRLKDLKKKFRRLQKEGRFSDYFKKQTLLLKRKEASGVVGNCGTASKKPRIGEILNTKVALKKREASVKKLRKLVRNEVLSRCVREHEKLKEELEKREELVKLMSARADVAKTDYLDSMISNPKGWKECMYYWTIRKIGSYQLLKEYIDRPEKYREDEKNSNPCFKITCELDYPLIYKGYYFADQKNFIKANRISVFKNKYPEILNEKNEIIFHVEHDSIIEKY
jgi:hypothetical protein